MPDFLRFGSVDGDLLMFRLFRINRFGNAATKTSKTSRADFSAGDRSHSSSISLFIELIVESTSISSIFYSLHPIRFACRYYPIDFSGEFFTPASHFEAFYKLTPLPRHLIPGRSPVRIIARVIDSFLVYGHVLLELQKSPKNFVEYFFRFSC